jgi:predicted transcriptional regulator
MGSKLEICVDILKVLAENGSLKASDIAAQSNASVNTLEGYLEFLINQGLIEERLVGKRSIVYVNTARGTSVIKFFTELDKTLTVVEDGKTLPVKYGDL